MATDAAQQRDANFSVISSNEAFLLESAWTFAETTTGAVDTHTLFTVTGNVLATVFGVCGTNLVGAATLEVGVGTNTAQLLAQIADATTLDAGDVYVDADTEVGAGIIPNPQVVIDDIDLTIGSAAVTAGVVTWYCLWRPLSDGSSVAVTTPA